MAGLVQAVRDDGVSSGSRDDGVSSGSRDDQSAMTGLVQAVVTTSP